MIYDLIAFDPLILGQSANTNIKGASVITPLVLTQAVDQNFESDLVSDRLVFAQRVAVVKRLNKTVAHSLALSQDRHHRATPVTAFQFLSIQDQATIEDQWPLVHHVLTFTQTAAVEVAKGTYSTLVLTQSVQLNVTRNMTVSHTLVMESVSRVFVPSYYWTGFPVVVVNP